MTQQFNVVGSRQPLVDGWKKVAGSAVYGDDVRFPGALQCRLLRSTLPHAKIVRIVAPSPMATDVPSGGALTGTCAAAAASRQRPPLASSPSRGVAPARSGVGASGGAMTPPTR